MSISAAIRIDYIQPAPGKPQQKAYVERFNRTVRFEWLSLYLWADFPAKAAKIAFFTNSRPIAGITGLKKRMFRNVQAEGRASPLSAG